MAKQCSSGACRYDYAYGADAETEGYLSTETMTVGLTTGGKSEVQSTLNSLLGDMECFHADRR
jgi:hypothetical protein